MEIRGLQKITLMDFPNKVACIIFTQYCNLRCPFCYNQELVLTPEKLPKIDETYFFKFLESRKGLLDGIVISGGEPTLQSDLFEFIKKCRSLGFLIKLDTNGLNFEVLSRLTSEKLLDYVALDFKEVRESGKIYKESDYENFLKSFEILRKSGITFEIRTTVVPGIHNEEGLLAMARIIGKKDKWFLQNFNPISTLDPFFKSVKPYEREFFDILFPKIKAIAPKVALRF